MKNAITAILIGMAVPWASGATAKMEVPCEISHVGCEDRSLKWKPRGTEVIREVESLLYDKNGIVKACEVGPLPGEQGAVHFTYSCKWYELEEGDKVKAYIGWNENYDGWSKAPLRGEVLYSIEPLVQD